MKLNSKGSWTATLAYNDFSWPALSAKASRARKIHASNAKSNSLEKLIRTITIWTGTLQAVQQFKHFWKKCSYQHWNKWLKKQNIIDALKCIITNGLSNGFNFKFADTGTTLEIFIVRKTAYITVKHCMTNSMLHSLHFSICTLSDVEWQNSCKSVMTIWNNSNIF